MLGYILTYLGGLISGVVIGSIGKFGGDALTDWRRAREAKNTEAARFHEVAALMPDFLSELGGQLDRAGRPCTCRTLFVIPHGRSIATRDLSFLLADDGRGNNYLQKADILQARGYIARLSTALEPPKFRMEEHFVRALLAWKIECAVRATP
jgi:hypothetical protein